jgi:hypothetical protein
MKLILVTATTNLDRASACLASWRDHAVTDPKIEIIFNGGGHGDYLGTVPAFRQGVDLVLANTDADIIACLHDDLEITESGWDQKVLRHFERVPTCGLLGFGGAIGLGSDRIYQDPYDPMQLARIGFRSNLHDAEQHGVRSLLPERVACLDGFSQIGRRDFWYGEHRIPHRDGGVAKGDVRPWTYLESLGITHHFYDGCLGCLARRYGWETWYLPIAATHYGGRTVVGDPGYQVWASTQAEGGDYGFWQQAHAAGYEAFKDVLPLRI